jgi:integrase
MDWRQFHDGWLNVVVQQKTKEMLSIPCHPILREALDAVRKSSGPIITNRFDRAYSTGDGLSDAFRERLRSLDIHDYSVHGLRKNAGGAVAEAGCSPHEIAAILGHRTLSMVQKYSKSADQKRRAKSAIDNG